ncbi:MAG: holo-ACP synthase [Campylobacterota bacterium]|nr:holo-ACP synthase [Campylobacterota bacterium]
MIGIDLIKIDRMKRMMDRFGEKALLRFLSPQEILHVKNFNTAAGFWAAKEACSKALGTGIGKECSFHDIEISKNAKGAPLLKVSQKLKKNFHIRGISLSITHDGDYAIAVVAIEQAHLGISSTTTDKV